MQALSYQLISNLVHYLGANQGGIYSLDKEGHEKANLVLTAA
jgi:hypothetical protein